MNKVLETTKTIYQNSKYVKINLDKLKQFSDELNIHCGRHWIYNGPFDISTFTQEQLLNFLFVYNSINFSYWGDPKRTIDYKGTQFDGGFGLIVALGKALANGYPILDYKYLSELSENDFDTILSGNTQIPLYYERLNILREIGKVMLSKFEGSFIKLLSKTQTDLELLETIVTHFPSFDDKSIYEGNEIFFYKRAQLLVSDIFQAIDPIIHKISTIENLTAFADYKIPQLLRKYGILEYTSELSNKIDNKIQIENGSIKELEIRSCTVWAIELMRDYLQSKFPGIQSVYIDDYIWLMSQNKTPDDKHYHLTRTTGY